MFTVPYPAYGWTPGYGTLLLNSDLRHGLKFVYQQHQQHNQTKYNVLLNDAVLRLL